MTGITFQSHCQETEPDGSSSVKIPSRLHLKLLHILRALVKENVKLLEMTTIRHNSLIHAQTNAAQLPPPPRTPCCLSVFAFCACVNYHNKPANSACRSVAEKSIISYLNENISNNRAQTLIVHIIHRFFRYSTPTVTTDTTVLC